MVDLATVNGRIMGSPWKGFVEFTLPASPPAAFVSADLNSTSPVGLSLSPYGRSVSAQPSALHPTFPHSPELDLFIEHPLLPLSALFLYPIILISRLRGWPRSLAMSSNERWRGKNDVVCAKTNSGWYKSVCFTLLIRFGRY